MEGSRPWSAVNGVLGLVGRLAVPTDVGPGRVTGLLGILWFAGGGAIVVGWSLGIYDGGRPLATMLVGTIGVTGGATFVLGRDVQLSPAVETAFTLIGSALIALAVHWAGPEAPGVTGMLYVYVTCFVIVARPSRPVTITLASASMHLVALLAAGYPAPVGIWAFTWVTALVTGLVVGAAVAWLRQLVGHLEQADEHKTRFVATISHELRTPLTAIIGFSETLERDWDRLGEADRRRFLGVIGRQAGRQLRLVEDVLTMSTLMRGAVRPRPERVDVSRLVADLVEALPFEVELDLAEPLALTVDPHHLERILDNLLVNADRYGRPPLVVRATPWDGGVRIDVVDHGGGIAGGLDGDLLQPFVQGDSGDRRTSVGVGLGLTLCRDLLELNDGRLEYEDTPGGGATVRLWLPDR